MEIAIVVTPNALDVVVPKVKVILDVQGAPLQEPLEVDLAEGSESQTNADRRIVVAGVNPLMHGLDPTQYI